MGDEKEEKKEEKEKRVMKKYVWGRELELFASSVITKGH